MFEMFTGAAQAAVVEAQEEAQERGDAHLGTEHLLLGLLREGTGLAATVLGEHRVGLGAVRAALDELAGPPLPAGAQQEALARMGIDAGQVREGLASSFGPGAVAAPPTPFDDGAKLALQAAVAEAGRLGHDEVGTEHELLGVLSVSDALGVTVLSGLGVDPAALTAEVHERFHRN